MALISYSLKGYENVVDLLSINGEKAKEKLEQFISPGSFRVIALGV
ncbi:hypothetical protein B488_05000 [Liberibacter crescens BT-1]|uniref:Uncharacterized protein n=1 Tax=Liberibacter crescens (strain BT-1) TaxID=1215343 RepID=L0EU72_LIBCB|nr:hypothetical protein B488_05000 [Liberibacter crescens BT-1]